jgi:hypothetical protein
LILDPYVKSFRHQFSGQPLNVYLFVENRGSSTHPDILPLRERIGIVPIRLPLGSSHILQPLDWWCLDYSKNITEVDQGRM